MKRAMWHVPVFLCLAAAYFARVSLSGEAATERKECPLPAGVSAVWDVSKAWRESTSTRERVCINGLWRWQPATDAAEATVPRGAWGYFKVPGSWPGITSYMQKDSQTVYAHEKWSRTNLADLNAAWYQREITIPPTWAGRRISLGTEYLNSYAVVFVDGRKVGEMRFPAGEVDLNEACALGGRYTLSLLVVALPLKGVMLSYTDTASARTVKGVVERRGICGDVFLVGTPAEERINCADVDTSVRKGEITVKARLENTKPGRVYSMVARIRDGIRVETEFGSDKFTAEELRQGAIAFGRKWKPDRLWDIHTPGNTYELDVSLTDSHGRGLDALPAIRFGFRELWIDGRDFRLNGSRIHLSAVPLDNAQIGASAATYAAARESLERLRTFGINFVYTHNYGCEPGAHLGFSEVLRAADDVGMLVALTQPHFSHYDWSAPDADERNGYARHAAFYARVAQNHPSVVMYATSHNATGYNEDMNPDRIDGLYQERDQWSSNNAKKALRAEEIIRSLDPCRIVYHHAGGNLGAMHTSNFYPNFVPEQELSDWFEHWATHGVKPLFLCEYGAPFTWDWAMYRGWYKGEREFGSAVVPWEFCLTEWNVQFFGDDAFQISENEKDNLRWEARQFRAGKPWHRWDYPHQLGSTDFPERDPVFARYYRDNWRAFRTWGVSVTSPWEHHVLHRPRPGVNRNRRVELPVDWDNLQRPGFSPDYIEQRYERMDLAYERSDWFPTGGGEALIRNNGPLLAWIGGKQSRFTSKDHIFTPGEMVEKQIIVINDSRETVSCECSWSLGLSPPITGRTNLVVQTGEQSRMPLRFDLPMQVTPGDYILAARVKFATGEIQEDEIAIHILPAREGARAEARIALFDPKGETAGLLRSLGVEFQTVEPQADLEEYDVLVIGKGALAVDGPAPDIKRVRDGLRVLVFEQKAEALERRLGFRTAEYGLRRVFPRVSDHPALAGLEPEHLRDWRGEATTLPPRLKYKPSPRFNHAPAVSWCGIEVTRVWRRGCQGNVASVLIEKPARGDFLPIVDGGFSLQFSPLLEYREGNGMVMFCQMDVTGRTEEEPAARILAANIIQHVCDWKPQPQRQGLYVGDPSGKAHLAQAGFSIQSYDGAGLKTEQALIVGPGGGAALAPHRETIASFLDKGGHLLAIALDQAEADAFLPFNVSIKSAEHISACFGAEKRDSPLAGVGPADVHNRDPRQVPLVTGGARVVGDGVLALASDGRVVFCQMAPWQFEYRDNYGLKRTFRRVSCLLRRLVSNLGVSSSTPLLTRFATPPAVDEPDRWLEGFYLDKPEEWDDPYRFFRW